MPRARRGLCAVLGGALLATLAVSVPADAAPVAPIFNQSIDDHADSDGADSCSPTEKPGVVKFRTLLSNAYPGTGGGIVRACSLGGSSEHHEGRAFDWMISAYTEHHLADDLFEWLFAEDGYGHDQAMVRRLGIMYIIWDNEIWRAYDAADGWQPYSGPNPHTDHVHFSFSWDGALEQTSYIAGAGAGRLLDQGRMATAWRGGRRLDLFRRGTDGALEQRIWQQGWSVWSSLGGDLLSGPTAGWTSRRSLFVFALGTDSRLYFRRWQASTGWAVWTPLGGPTVTSAPAVVADDGRLDLVVRSEYGTVIQLTWRRRPGWSSWLDLGGATTAAPSLTWRTGRILHVLARDALGRLAMRTRDRRVWTGWLDLGGQLTSSPASASLDRAAMNIFARGEDGAVWQRYYDQGWSQWVSLGGAHVSGTSAGAVRKNRIDVFTRSESGQSIQNAFQRTTGWSGWLQP